VSARIAALGYEVLVSTATDIDIDVGEGGAIKRRVGRMTLEEMIELIKEKGVRAVVDTTHPFAAIVRGNARKAARAAGAPYFTFVRPGLVYDCENIIWAEDYEQAAEIAFSFGETVLTATGSKSVAIFAKRSRETGVKMVARVLDYPKSMEACRAAGLSEDCVIAERGPFTVERNLLHFTRYGAGVIVTKDSGLAGGVPEKVEAARRSGRKIVMIRRPDHSGHGVFKSVDELMEEFERTMKEFA
jgi:precorrin-6A/cobalt-precorrin-6A reductase